MGKISSKKSQKSTKKRFNLRTFIPLAKKNSFSLKGAVIVSLASGIVGAVFMLSSQAAPVDILTKEAESLNLTTGNSLWPSSSTTDSTASGGKAVKFDKNSVISGSINLSSTVTSISVRAKGDQCGSEAPKMVVKVDGIAIASSPTAVSGSSWTDYSTATNITAGTKPLEVSFINDYDKYRKNGRLECSRNLYADKITFSGDDAVVPPAKLVPLNGVLFGAFHSNRTTDTNEVEYANFETLVGRTMDINHHYADWNTTYWPGSYENWDVAGGRIPMDSWGGKNLTNLDAVINGSQDSIITAKAQKIKAFGHNMFLRLWWEMNGNWNYTYQGVYNNDVGTTNGPSKYVQAWRRVHDIFQREGVNNAVFVWSPNCDDSPRETWNHWGNYYPGDAYVDWVACDGYNWGTAHTWSSWQSWSQIYGRTPSVYSDYLQKPFMVAETSSCELGGDKGAWISQMQSDIKSNFPNIKAFVWFDSDNRTSENCDWRVNSSQGALDAYRVMGADPYFQP